jgi:glutamine synthetase
MPRSLWDAMVARQESAMFQEKLGDQFVDYILIVKQSEVSRILFEVNVRVHQEYFSLF